VHQRQCHEQDSDEVKIGHYPAKCVS
jgi:hypothetical protein